MENQIYFDTSLFLYSIALGFLIGLFYEIFRFLRLAIRHGALAVAAEDLLFFLPVTGSFILFTYVFSDGIVRWFSVAGGAMGAFLYFRTVGKLLLSFSDAILRLIRSIIRWLFTKTVLPLWNVFKNITKYLYTKTISFGIIINEKRIRSRLKKEKRCVLKFARRGFGC